ncbi:MAG: hypothetical protein ACK42C_02380 [Aquificaceae bacterium]|jgi:hypothetical protein|uniref:hypothetical protein n=1 Tax=Hydrogenobacter sp. Uz 6-8 TaxID=3384828 RepID=UPI000F178367|nr:MAG: hypothetical protein D6804_08440 [Aquificota bacterium]
MLREALKLLFLIVSYNFILHYLSTFLPVPLFPYQMEDILMVASFVSALYLAWLFGYRERTVIWLAYVSLFQVVGLSFLREDYEVITQFLPPLLLTVSLIWLFESPMERRTRRLEEERRRLEEELRRNDAELRRLLEQINLSKDLAERLSREKEIIEREFRRLREEELAEKEELEREREILVQKLQENQRKLTEYTDRLERLTKINRELFEMLEAIQDVEPKGGKEEVSRLRQERKRLSRELIQMQELLEELSRENMEISKKYEDLLKKFEQERRERERLEVEVENLLKQVENRKEVYEEVFSFLFENIEFEERAIREFLELDRVAKREFLRELMLLNMKDRDERFEVMKGYRNVFKLKPMGGRIYFTFGGVKRWKVIGMLWGEEDKTKDRYARELLVKYKD